MILAGDIGGTKTVLAHYEELGGGLRQLHTASYHSKDFKSLETILAAYLKDNPGAAPRAACFGVAGPVFDGKCHATNLPWDLDERDLARAIGAPRAKLLNDLETTGYGILQLPANELCVLNPGNRPGRRGNAAVIAAGTGLGEAILYWDGQRYHPIATEGGHVDFAPRTDQEIDLLRYLRTRIGGRVSVERVLSGPGFHEIYCFLRDSGHASESPQLAALFRTEDPNPTITRLGLSGADPLCVATLQMFSTLYGSEAGNMALKCLAVGGVFVGGGIAPKILRILQDGSFLRGFKDKGRFTDFMKSLEVSVSLNPEAALLGAAYYALHNL
jgi:glucokinase